MFISLIGKMISRAAPKESFRSNVLTLMTGSIIAQVIPIAILPILARFYTPADFGIYALYMSVVALMSIVATGRYELAIMLPSKDEDAVNIVALSLVVTLLVSAFSFVLVWMFNYEIAIVLGNAEISNWLYFVPISVLSIGSFQSFNYWSNRKKQFKRLAVSRIAKTSSASVLNLGVGYFYAGPTGLVIGSIFGQIVATGVFGWQILKEDRDKVRFVTRCIMLKNAKKYIDFLKVNSFHALTDVLQSSGVVFLISSFFGSLTLGLYSFSMRIILAPLGLIGSSIAQVFYQKASSTYNENGDLHSLLKNMLVKLFFISLPFFLLFVVFAPSLFTAIFGQKWEEAGVYAQILSPWIFCKFIISPVSSLPIIVGKQKHAFYFSLVGNLLIILSISYGIVFEENIKNILFIWSTLLTIFTVVQIKWYVFISRKLCV